jgi:hypothetical protein
MHQCERAVGDYTDAVLVGFSEALDRIWPAAAGHLVGWEEHYTLMGCASFEHSAHKRSRAGAHTPLDVRIGAAWDDP